MFRVEKGARAEEMYPFIEKGDLYQHPTLLTITRDKKKKKKRTGQKGKTHQIIVKQKKKKKAQRDQNPMQNQGVVW